MRGPRRHGIFRFSSQPVCCITNGRVARASTGSIGAVSSSCAIGLRGFRRILADQPFEEEQVTAKKNEGDRNVAVGAKPTADEPQLFRINIEVGNLDEAADFYTKLLGVPGRKQAGARCYFTCGAVTLQVVDV